MNNPSDFFTFAHASVGFIFGKLKINRWLCYSVAIGWEILQFYLKYKPQGSGLEDIWLDSVVDIVAYVIFYEVALKLKY